MKCNYPTTSLALRSLATVLLTLALSLHGAFSQDIPKDLESKLCKLISKLESKQDNDPQAKAAITAARQLKFALSEKNPGLLANQSGGYGRMPLGEYQAEIQRLAKQVSESVTANASKRQKEWAEQVDSYVQKVEQACIKGMPTGQLETLLAAGDDVTHLAPKTSRSSYGRTGGDATKLNAATLLLQQWLVYKRLEEKGYLKQAHDKLRSLASSTPSYPILDKAFLDDKIAEAKDAMGEEITRTARGDNLSKTQKDTLKKLENGKLNAQLVSEVANTLDALPYSHDMRTKYNDRFYLAIQALADSLHFVEISDPVKAREKLSEFASESHSVPQLKKVRSKAIFQLVPILYAKIGAKKPKAEERLEAYAFKLIREPGTLDQVAIYNDLITFYRFLTPNSTYYSGGKAHKWKDSARKQFSLLGSASESLESEDYAFVLKQLREAQEVATLSGPANASKLIGEEIEKLRKLKPKLFETSMAAMVAEIETLQNQVDKLKKEAVELRRKVR